MATCTPIEKSLVELSHKTDVFTERTPRINHLSRPGIFSKEDLLIFPQETEMYEYEEEYYNHGQKEKQKVVFLVCQLLKNNGYKWDYYYFPMEVTRCFFEIQRNRYGEYDSLTEPHYHFINGIEGEEWLWKQVDMDTATFKKAYVDPLLGKTLLVEDVKNILTDQINYQSKNNERRRVYKNIISFRVLDDAHAETLKTSYLIKNELLKLSQEVMELKRRFNSGFDVFVRQYQLNMNNATKETYELILRSKDTIKLFDLKQKVEDLIRQNPSGLKIVYTGRKIDAHTLQGYEEIWENGYKIRRAQEEYEKEQKESILEPKYAESPYLKGILRSMDLIKKDYYAECTMLDVWYNINNNRDILVAFGKSVSEMSEYEINDRYAYRTTLHYLPRLYITYEKGISKANLIRKIIDKVEADMVKYWEQIHKYRV